MALDISKAFYRVWHAGLLHKHKYNGISGQTFGHIFSFLSNRWVDVDGKSSLEYPCNSGVSQGSILNPTLFLTLSNNRPDDVICNIAIYADDTTHYCKRDHTSDLRQQLEVLLNLNLIYETLWTGTRSGLMISMLEKVNWFHVIILLTLLLLIRIWMQAFMQAVLLMPIFEQRLSF